MSDTDSDLDSDPGSDPHSDEAEPLRRTEDTTVRYQQRASFDRELANRILDAAFVAHVGFATSRTGEDGGIEAHPFVIPMIYGRDGDRLYLHGSVATRLTRQLDAGAPVCVTVTHVDGLVLARSQFHHSVNYRSVVLLGRATRLRDAEAERALAVIVDHAAPGRSAEARPTNRIELRQTMVLSVPIDEGSVKVRTGGPVDDAEDMNLDVWAGVLPLAVRPGDPIPDDGCGDLPLPPSVVGLMDR